jgi:superfamily II DNA/RNA helicase
LNFSELSLQPPLQQAVARLGYKECTPIQVASMPLIMSGKDVAGLAQTGTGKTAAFLIPIMERILRSKSQLPESFGEWKARNFVLILVPTRELAEQVFDNIQSLGQEANLRGCSVYGGTSYDKQKELLQAGVEFVVATPGRLIDLYKENFVDLKQVRAIIFDEADRMFDMGFKDDMKYILQRVPRERQFLVFSATLNFDVLNTAYMFGAEPVEVDVSRDQARAEHVKDVIFHLGQNEKPQHLLSLFKLHKPKQAIIFSNFKVNVDKIARFLTDNGVPAMAISSLLTQAQRLRVMEQFKGDNDMNILVATDVAARGLDIKGVDMVVNFEIPQDAENYVHRIGRTGRAGAEGRAFSFVSDRDVENLARVEDYLKHKVDVEFLEDKDLIKEFKPFIWEDSSRSLSDYGDRGESRRPSGGRGGPDKRNDRRPPRRDRPERSNDGSRGPSDRGERREKRAEGGAGAQASNKPHHNRGRERDAAPKSGAKHDHRGPRHERPERSERGGERRFDKPRDRQSEGAKSGSHSRPHNKHQGAQRAKISPAKKSIGQKISGFFKKILGG